MRELNFKFWSKSLSIAICLLMINHSRCSAVNIGSTQLDNFTSKLLPAHYQNLTIDDMKRVFQEKCRKTGNPNITPAFYKEVEVAANNLTKCLSSLANNTIVEEINAARPMGELDTVFHKYCLKAPELEKCLGDFNEKVQPCLTKEERNQNGVLLRIVKTLVGFMCSRGGDQIALFVAEEGPECLEANKEAIIQCANSSFAEYWPKDGKAPDFLEMSEFVLSPEHCIDFERFEKCTIHHLEQCTELTPANVAESVFKFIKNETSCSTWIGLKANQRSVLKDPRDGAPSSQHMNLGLIILGTFALIIYSRRLCQ